MIRMLEVNQSMIHIRAICTILVSNILLFAFCMFMFGIFF